jgi:hypothetical protein
MIDNNWIETLLQRSEENTQKEQKIYNNPLEQQLIIEVINACYKIHEQNRSIRIGRLLASAFDLVVTADYYMGVGHRGWFYCPSPTPKLYYHFTNCCPRHALENIFYFHASSKPESGNIGKSTSRLLRNFLSELLKNQGRQEIILKGAEPVDVIIVNKATHHIFFGEIKASPLLTLPLIMDSEELTDDKNNKVTEHDGNITINSIYKRPFSVFVPTFLNGKWQESSFNLGIRQNIDDVSWSYRAMLALLQQDPKFLLSYYKFWDAALTKYHPKITESIYWLTNGCGAPNPRPEWWPKSKGGDGEGFESVSDSKTSVGMDRTDDIKKGIYQVLKLGSEGKAIKSKWKFKIGIVSNIHAARHFEEYLESLKNLIWTHDLSGKAKKAGDLNEDHPLYNLFDGMITLTECHFRDKWLKAVFSFNR